MNKHLLRELFLTFMKIGLFTFGGGYAMITIIENYCVDQKKWITHEDMMNVTIIAESTPGSIALNCSTFVGFKIAGILGALVSTFGMVLPSFTIIFAISMFLDNFLEITIIANAFSGIKIAVGFLIVTAGIRMLCQLEKKSLTFLLFLFSFSTMFVINLFSLKFSSVSLMLICAGISLVIYTITHVFHRKEEA